MANAAERAGIIKDENGDLFIPASQRPDGTWRKAKRVKDGYVPQEEVAVYESKGQIFAKSVPACPGLAANVPHINKKTSQTSEEAAPVLSKAAKKNQRRKEMKKQQQTAATVNDVTADLERVTVDAKDAKIAPDAELEASKDASAYLEKKLKNLKKKLRKVDELKAKIDSGDLKNPEKDQLEKVGRRQEVVEEIEDLELQLEGLIS